MPTQQELDDAVIAAAQALSAQLHNLDEAEKQRAGFKAAKDAAEEQRVVWAQATRDRRDEVKVGAVALNNAIVAANAGPTP